MGSNYRCCCRNVCLPAVRCVVRTFCLRILCGIHTDKRYEQGAESISRLVFSLYLKCNLRRDNIHLPGYILPVRCIFILDSIRYMIKIRISVLRCGFFDDGIWMLSGPFMDLMTGFE